MEDKKNKNIIFPPIEKLSDLDLTNSQFKLYMFLISLSQGGTRVIDYTSYELSLLTHMGEDAINKNLKELKKQKLISTSISYKTINGIIKSKRTIIVDRELIYVEGYIKTSRELVEELKKIDQLHHFKF